MKLIPLTQGKFAKVDDELYDDLMQYKWCIGPKGCAIRQITREDGKRRTLYMHRYITNAPDGLVVDHINRDKLDNRRENLRNCSNLENSRNSWHKKHKHLEVKYKGINPRLRTDMCANPSLRWEARISFDGKINHLGSFDTAIEAAYAYDQAAIKYFGEFALTNGIRKEDVVFHEKTYTSAYRGVWRNKEGKYIAEIKVDKKKYHIGTFSDPKLAAEAYNKKALELLGDKAFLNEI